MTRRNLGIFNDRNDKLFTSNNNRRVDVYKYYYYASILLVVFIREHKSSRLQCFVAVHKRLSSREDRSKSPRKSTRSLNYLHG